MAKIVKQCQDLPGQELFEYQLESGEPAKVGSNDVNEYLREITQEDFSAKDFRTWHGTGHMAAALAKLGPAETERHAKLNIVDAVKETAKYLANRPAACRKYYIHPAVFESYTEKTIFSMIRNVPDDEAPSHTLRPFELSVMKLVEAYTGSRGNSVKSQA